MCGISGVFSTSQLHAEHIFSSLSSIKHRGPDETYMAAFTGSEPAFFSCALSSDKMKQTFNEPGAHQSKGWLGYNRLAIVDTSDKGGIPLYDGEQDCLFLMNGEIYNYMAIADMFLKDETRDSETDTEVAFRLYLKFGDQFISYLRGMFVIVVVHPQRKQIKVWRDRLGIKPFYYTQSDHHFIFSSEINGIFATGLVDADFDKEKLAHQLYLTGSLSPATIYKNIFSLEPGKCLTIDTGSFESVSEPYWQMEYQRQERVVTAEEFLSDVRELAEMSVSGIDEIDKAIMLSGGLDSGLLAFLLRNNPKMQTCTIFSDTGQKGELHYTRKNARHAGLPLLELAMPTSMPPAMLEAFCLAEEEPNISPEPAYFLSCQMKNKVRVLYNALGPDELFYGYGHHVKAMKLKQVIGLSRFVWDKLLPAGKREKFNELRRFGMMSFPFISRSVAGWSEIKKLFAGENTHAWQHPLEVVLQQAQQNFPDINRCDVMKQLSYLDIYYYISSYHSFRSDRPSMLNHIEMRFPYLDHHFVQKYFNLANLEIGLRFGNEKPFFRKQIQGVMDPAVFAMKKIGFAMDNTWYKQFDNKLIAKRLSGLLSAEAVDQFCSTPEKNWLLFSLSALSTRYIK